MALRNLAWLRGNIMCVAYPGKVVSVKEKYAQVDFSGSVVEVNISMVPVLPGDYVLVLSLIHISL